MADRDIEDLLQALTLPAPGAGDSARTAAAGTVSQETMAEFARTASLFSDRIRSVEPVGAGAGHPAIKPAPEAPSSAQACFDAGDIRGAALRLLDGVAGRPAKAEEALSLAICAARLGQFEAAQDFAQASLAAGLRHPRALCILGLCDLLRGSKAEAQGRLALAARLARGQPEFREDMRMAQKLLLIRHFG